MMHLSPSGLIKQYLAQQHMMQLATMRGEQPWICTVYFVIDDTYNLYWASLPSRRHSQEIAEHPNVAAAVPVNFVKGEPVAGLQIEGTAEMLQPAETHRPIAQRYAEKFGRDDAWVDAITTGRTEHRLYKLTPALYVLFDEVHFSGDQARQEITDL